MANQRESQQKHKRKKVFIDQPIPEEGIALLKKSFTVKLRTAATVISRRELLKEIKQVHALLPILTDTLDAEVMDAAPRLQVIGNYAVGTDNIDIDAATERGIVVTNTPGVLDQAVAEHTLALMLSVARRIVESDKFTRAKKFKGWMPMGFLGLQLQGKTLGIIGAGRIGSKFAEMCKNGLGMKIVYNDVGRNSSIERKLDATYLPLKQLLRQSDVVSVHVPLLPSTRHFIGAAELRLMKPSAILINTSRGPVVAEKPLVKALQQRLFFGVGLDVYECEPSIDCDPNDQLALSKLDSVVLTPHIASATIEARSGMSLLAAQGIADVLQGKKPKHIVNPEVWKVRRT